MKKTVKDATIEKLYPILSEARLSKLNAAGRRAVFDALCDSNPEWTAGQCVELKDLLCEDNKAETEETKDAE